MERRGSKEIPFEAFTAYYFEIRKVNKVAVFVLQKASLINYA